MPEHIQDTIPGRIRIIRDTINPETRFFSGSTSSDSIKIQVSPADSALSKKRKDLINSTLLQQGGIVKQDYDTISVCVRNPVADVTFNNPSFVLNSIDQHCLNRFPYLFTSNNLRINSEKKAILEKHLRAGEMMPVQMFHENWVFGILIFVLLFFSVVQSTTKSFFPAINRFFLFRGTSEEGIRDIMGIFQWQTTILNLSSFMLIALFCSFAAFHFDVVPYGITGFIAWLIVLGIIIVSVTIRHFICFLTGEFSNQRAVFHDYLHTVYQSYRFGASFIFILLIMMLYTRIMPDRSYFIIGAVLVGIVFVIRILRLFIIFINRNISIFYLILYLCALEILPVLIAIKYFSGLT